MRLELKNQSPCVKNATPEEGTSPHLLKRGDLFVRAGLKSSAIFSRLLLLELIQMLGVKRESGGQNDLTDTGKPAKQFQPTPSGTVPSQKLTVPLYG